jgi:hypothetical protein
MTGAMAETSARGAPAPPTDAQEPTGQLLRDALEETRELVRLEVALAREEIKAEMAKARGGAIAMAGGVAAALSGVTLCLVAIAAAFSVTWLAALILGIFLLASAGAAGLFGWRALPRRLLRETRDRFEADVKGIKERIV